MGGEASISAYSRGDVDRANAVYAALKCSRPKTRGDLKNYIKVFLGIDIPDKVLCPGHCSPMDYLWYSFGIDFSQNRPGNGDVVVWAGRGGGKTELAAIGTLLDCIFKPGCQVRILGGSEHQAGRMYGYLASFLQNNFEEFLAGSIRKGKSEFVNGSAVEVLTQSMASVRGQHIHKLRCDEIELFDEHVFAAAKFTTQSTDEIVGAMEIISTMHRPYGMMQRAVSDAEKFGVPIFKWCMWEVIEKCVGRNCGQCELWCDCGGKAKNANGYLKIDDCITQMKRASRAGWESEMLCRKPNLENVVFDEFDSDVHVKEIDFDLNLPIYRAIDFGFANPFVCLWIQVDEQGCVRVVDEYVKSRVTVAEHGMEMKRRTPVSEENVAGTYCDPAGAGSNDITGSSAVKELRSMGIIVNYRRSLILEGIELIRRVIRSGDGKSKLLVSPKCAGLIEAMRCYHYSDGGGEMPVKDGVYDHPIDALRYFFVNFSRRGARPVSRRY